MNFSFFQPTFLQTMAFCAILVIVFANLFRIANTILPKGKLFLLLGVFMLWLGIHGAVAWSGVLEKQTMPPPLVIYLALTLGVGIVFSISKWGELSAQKTPLLKLVMLQVFRLPLEMVLASLASNGNLPYEMTFYGFNFDIATGAIALLIVLLSKFKTLPLIVFWIWNSMGFVLLMVIGVVAPLSSPIPIRVFESGPPLVLAMFLPWTWIISVCVFVALVGHLVIYRKLWSDRKEERL